RRPPRSSPGARPPCSRRARTRARCRGPTRRPGPPPAPAAPPATRGPRRRAQPGARRARARAARSRSSLEPALVAALEVARGPLQRVLPRLEARALELRRQRRRALAAEREHAPALPEDAHAPVLGDLRREDLVPHEARSLARGAQSCMTL